MADEEVLSGKGVNANEQNLNSLFYEVLKGIREDLSEADDNAKSVLQTLENTDSGIILLGPIYNEALKIKSGARDAQLKFLGLFKDRVSKKEIVDIQTKKNKKEFSHLPDKTQLNKLLKEMDDDEKEKIIEPIETFDEDDE